MAYKLTVFGNHIYREVELYEDKESSFLIGTTPSCQVRFNRSYFFDDFEINVNVADNTWYLSAKTGVFFKTGKILKQLKVELNIMEAVEVCYENTGGLLFSLEFARDYDRERKAFDCCADISGINQFYIGADRQCQIYLPNFNIGGTIVNIIRSSSGYDMEVAGDYNLVYRNGFRIKSARVYLNNTDFFSIAEYSFFITEDFLYYAQTSKIISEFAVILPEKNMNAMIYPKFQRNTRQRYALPKEMIEVLDPKSKGTAPKKNLLMTLVPTIASLVMMVGLRGVMGGGGMFVVYSVAMMAIGGGMSVWTYFNDGKEYKEKEKEREEKYQLYIESQENKIELLRDKELAILQQRYISVEEDIRLVQDFDQRLFERQKTDEDFLCIYLGTGTVKSACPVKYKIQEYKDVEDSLMEYPQMLAEKYEHIDYAPVYVDLKNMNALGIVGSRDRLYQLLKNMVIDLCVRQFYEDVKLFFIFDEKYKKQFEWMRWFRHTSGKQSNERYFVYDMQSEKAGLEFLYSELSRRENIRKEMCMQLPRYVIFVYSSEILKSHPVTKYIKQASDLGFTFVFFEEYPELLEQGCDKVITLNQTSNEAMISNTDEGQQQYFVYEHISTKLATECALRLGCVYVDEVSLEGQLTKNISLFEMMHVMNVGDLNLKKRWATSKIYETMAAPLGISASNEVICLDLHEKAHGPHGLVAGTTGSGKSEILQSYILSMATLFHPYDVGFVIIDFKGGGMVNQFRNLPHLNGAITNMDGREIERSLQSIRAELRKRQALFAQYNVNHIDAYIRKFKSGETKTPLPHLILIVDEFAELKSDQPEFMKELISTARIGRSLGVHLILATQKPSGVVDDQIWSNSRFKLCLKVQNKEDSMEVLKSPLAAEIKEPGRAYLQVGNNEIFQLFQSAYSGAPSEVNSEGQQKSYKIYQIELSGARKVLYEQKIKASSDSLTQLDALVNYIHDYCVKKRIKNLPDICLPPLEKMLHFPKVWKKGDTNNICIPVGVYDDPANQRQEEVLFDLTAENTFILGSSQYGKTNLLQSMLRCIGTNYAPEDVQVYIIDFASMILKNFEGMCHVGGVVTSNEDEKLKTLVKLLLSELKVRKEILLNYGLSSFAAYREAEYKEMPQIILMIDNMTALKELYPQYEDTLLTLCREGLSAGISIVIANSQTSGIGYKYFSNFSRRIALYCNDVSEYTYMFEHCRIRPMDTPGRGILTIDKTVYEFQAYLAFDAEKEIDKSREMRNFIMFVNEKYPDSHAKKIPEIPKVLTDSYIKDHFAHMHRMPYSLYLGINFANTEMEIFALNQVGVIGVSGKSHSGKTNFVKYVISSLIAQTTQEPVEIHIFDSVDRKLVEFKDANSVGTYTLDATAVKDVIQHIDEVLKQRYEQLAAEIEMSSSLLVLVLQNRDCLSVISSDKQTLEAYKRITSRYKMLNVLIFITDIENTMISFASPEVLKIFKEHKNLVLFENLGDQKLHDVPLAVMREYNKPLEQGEAYKIEGNNLIKVKTVLRTDRRDIHGS